MSLSRASFIEWVAHWVHGENQERFIKAFDEELSRFTSEKDEEIARLKDVVKSLLDSNRIGVSKELEAALCILLLPKRKEVQP